MRPIEPHQVTLMRNQAIQVPQASVCSAPVCLKTATDPHDPSLSILLAPTLDGSHLSLPDSVRLHNKNARSTPPHTNQVATSRSQAIKTCRHKPTHAQLPHFTAWLP